MGGEEAGVDIPDELGHRFITRCLQHRPRLPDYAMFGSLSIKSSLGFQGQCP